MPALHMSDLIKSIREKHGTKVFFFVSTPVQVATFSAVLGCHEIKNQPNIIPLFVNLGCFYSYKGTCDAITAEGFPWISLETKKSYTKAFANRQWTRVFGIVEAKHSVVRLIRDLHPKVVVLGNDVGPIEKIIIDTAKKSHIPTLLIQDGILCGQSTEDYGPKPHSFSGYFKLWNKFLVRRLLSILGIISMPNKYGGGSCTKIAAMGPYSREVLIAKRAIPENIVITGQPRFDPIIKPNNERHESEYVQIRQSTLSQKKGIILFAGSWRSRNSKFISPKEDLFMICCLNDVAQALWDTHRILIRPHPNDDPQDYLRALRSLGETSLEVNSTTDLWSQIRSSDVVVTYGSTVGIEAVVLGKPLVTLPEKDGIEIVPYSKSGVAVHADRWKELIPAVKKALFSQEFRSHFEKARKIFLEYHLGSLDGQASRRVHYLILSMAKM